ncbi:MAG: YlcI/YnfO family protein [Rhodanobacter sp.]
MRESTVRCGDEAVRAQGALLQIGVIRGALLSISNPVAPNLCPNPRCPHYKEKGRDPFRHFSGKFNARIDPELHAHAVEIATAEGVSLNQFVERAIEHEVYE